MALHELKLPCQDGTLVAIDHLPDDVQDVVQVLESEAVPLQHWWDLARAYLAQGRTTQYLALLQSALEPDLLQAVEDFFKKRPTFEIVLLTCGCAAHYIEQYRQEQDKQLKQQHYQDALARINTAKQEGPNEQLPYLASGCLALAKGDVNTAMAEFKNAAARTHNGRRNMAGLLGQAGIHFNAGRIGEALGIYKAVLRQHPGAPAEVRLGLAACFFKAGAMDLAQAAYERVLELDPRNADALMGLAVLHLNGRNVQQGLASGIELLSRAFKSDPGHPGVLAALSHFLMLQGHYQRALQLSEASLLGADNDPLRAFATVLRARACHALGRLADAERHYAAAIRLDSRAPLPRLGVAQMYIRKGEVINAASELEAALTAAPANVDALRLLGALAAEMPERAERNVKHFRDAAAKHHDDADLHEMLGELLCGTDPRGALEAYEAALRAHRAKAAAAAKPGGSGGGEEEHRVPAKLLNNVAVLRYRSGQVREALSLMEEAVQNMMQQGAMDALHKVTLGYNIARVKEAAGDLKAAAEEYQKLLENFPSYIDCYLRLACIERESGDAAAAVAWAERAAEQGGDHADANALLATLHLDKNDLESAVKCLNRIMKPQQEAANGAAGGQVKDPYAQLVLASVHLRLMPAGKTPEARAKAQDNLAKAQHIYRSVLKASPSNAYAANGLGVCLAETGHLDAAREAFLMVQEAAVSSQGFMKLPDVYINQANIALAKQSYEQALALYERASAAHDRKDAQFLLYTARALYDKDDLLGARRALEAAIHVAPTDAKLRFNLALCLQEWAVRVFKRQRPEGDLTKVPEYEEATERLLQAHSIFTALLARGKGATKIEPRKLQVHIDFCQRTHRLANQHLNVAQREAAVIEAKRVKYEESLKAQAAIKAEEELRRQAAEEAQRMEVQQRIQKQQEEFREKLEKWNRDKQMIVEDGGTGDKGGKGGGKKRRRKKGAEEDGFLVDDEEGGGGGGGGKGRSKGAKSSDEEEEYEDAVRRAGLASDEDEEGADLEELFGGDDEDAVEGAAAGKKPGGGGGKKRQDKPDKADKGGGRLKRKAAAAPGSGGGEGAGGGEGDSGGAGGGGGEGGPGGKGQEEELEDHLGDDIFADPLDDDDSAGDGAAAGGGGGEDGGGGGGGGGRKRARHGAAISDDEDDE